ncbi:MAG: GAF domain-containing protein [Thermoleophilia bacterium]
MTRRPEKGGSDWLRVAEVARRLGVSANTVRRWTDAGRLAAYRSPGGHRRYLDADIRALLPDAAAQGGGAHPGDFAELRRQTQALRAEVQAGVDLTAVLTDAPREVPELVARRLCELSEAPRCEVYVLDGDRLRLTVSVDGGEPDLGRIGDSWPLADWLPVEGPADELETIVLRRGAGLGSRGRAALQRRGCQALMWAPLKVRGALIGAVELSDARPRDLSAHAALVAGLAAICAHALDVDKVSRTLERRDKAIRELMDVSREVSQTHDLRRFAGRFAHRLLAAVNVDCVSLYRVRGGVIRTLVSVDRDGVDEARFDAILDTSLYPSLERTLTDHTPLIIGRLGDPRLSPGEVALYREWGYASSLTLPLVAGDGIVGLVELYDDAERDWEPELEYLAGVTQLVAGLFDNAILLSEAEERSRLRSELVELNAHLAAAGSQEGAALVAAEHLRRVAGCADCDVWWLQEGYLRCLASVDEHGPDESVRGNTLEVERFPSTAAALKDRETLVFTSLDDPRITDYEREDWREYGFRSGLSVPLVCGDAVVGLLDLFDTRERDYNEVRGFIGGAARSVADVLQNAYLMKSLRQGNAALRELVELSDQLTEAEDLAKLCRIAAARLRAVLRAEDCDIWEIEDGRLRCLASIDGRGWDEKEVGTYRDLAGYGATLAALAADEPMVIGDLETAGLSRSEMRAYRRWGYRSMVSLPLVVEGRPIGLIDVFDTKVRDYTNRLDFIRNVGRLLAGAFERAMLVDRLEAGNRDLRLLVDSGMAFGATLEADAVLDMVARRILEVSGADTCDIHRLQGDTFKVLVSVGAPWAEAVVGRSYPVKDYGLLRRALETRRLVHCLDIPDDPTMTPQERAAAREWGYRASVDVPLISSGEVIGFVCLYHREARPFEREDVIVGLAQIAGQAIANADVHEELRENVRRMTLMTESALELAGSLDLRDTLLATARRLCDSVAVTECEITVIEGDHLRTLMRVADGEIDEEWIGRSLAMADARASREVIETRRPAVVESLRDPRLTPRVPEIDCGCAQKSWATLPLVVKDRVIGTVELVDGIRERSFAQAELDTAVAICHAAAMAIENAALFEREQVAHRESLLLNQIARRTAASLDLEEVVEAAVDELRQILPFDGHSLLLLADSTVERVLASDEAAASLLGFAGSDVEERLHVRIKREPVLLLELPDGAPLPSGHPSLTGLRSAAVIALPSDDGILGALSLVSGDEHAFRDTDVHLLERVGTQLSLAIKNTQLYDEIKRMHLGNLKALGSALNAKDYYTLGHAARVSAYTILIGRQLGWSEDLLSTLEEAAYLHDIGKISISDRVLLKAGRLNPMEWQQMRQHPVFSADIIRPLFSEQLVLAVRHHHERYDGDGYPDGLRGERIPLLARALAVVDAYDAMSCRRPYKAGLTYPECLAELQRCRGTQFDPGMVDAFLEVLKDIGTRRAQAQQIAAAAAARIPGELHRALRTAEDEGSPQYRQIAEILREVRDANPPTRFLTTHAQIDKKYVIGVDPEEDESQRSHFGDEIFPDDELPLVLNGERPDLNTVLADEFGLWLSGLAPIRDAEGQIVAAVAADLPALGDAGSDSLREDRSGTFALMLRKGAMRLIRAEIDATTDALTGLYNHRSLHERLSEELQRAREVKRPLSVLFCDIDHFKAYNDSNGHSAGDAVLREVAHIIEESVRSLDVACRYGGEEFVLVLVDTGPEAARSVAERVRERIRTAGFSADGRPLTVSIGVAAFPQDAQRRDELLDKADAAMYLAKGRGRDQVAAYSAE